MEEHGTPTTSAGEKCAFVDVAIELQGFALRFADSHEKIAEVNALVDRGMAEVVDLVRRAEVAEEAYSLIERSWREKSEGPSGNTVSEGPSSLDERQPAESSFITAPRPSPVPVPPRSVEPTAGFEPATYGLRTGGSDLRAAAEAAYVSIENAAIALVEVSALPPSPVALSCIVEGLRQTAKQLLGALR